jgi:glycosyltransferase involved in cell wall biosynthesis
MKTIALTMIVKNEGHIITRCLDSVKPLIDYALIIDTGSTDDTIERIKSWLSANNVDGVVLQEEWVDFATNRSSALEKLRSTRPDIDYALAIDADEVLRLEGVDITAVKKSLTANWYTFTCKLGSLEYLRVSLLKNSLPFRYRGALHEFVQCDGIPYGSGTKLEGIVNTPIQDSSRNKNKDKYSDDAKLLEKALLTETELGMISRYTFYLGQSLMDSKQYEKAIEAYEKRATQGGWDQEVYWSLYKSASMREGLNRPEDEVIQSYMKAFEVSPDRIEALHNAARFCRFKNKFNQGYIISKHARTVPVSKTGLFLEKWMWDYGIDDEFSIACYYTNHYDEGIKVCESLLNRIPAEHKDRVAKNLHFFREKLGLKTSVPATSGGKMKIDLGCGSRKRGPDWVGFDCQKLPGVDVVGDANERIPFEDNVADEVAAFDFLEHVHNDKRIHIMHEIWRILKPGGILTSFTPSTEGRGAFQDPTHYAFWNENSFLYYTDDAHRKLYSIVPKFDVVSIKTTPMNHLQVCYVEAVLRAVK